jgi:hypothetical protein
VYTFRKGRSLETIQLKVRRVRDCRTYFQALPKNGIKEGSAFWSVAGLGLSPTVEYTKRAQGYEEELVVRLSTTKKDCKSSV